MRFLILIFLLLSIIYSCNKNDRALPIDRAKLVDILVDVHVAEAVLQEYTFPVKDSIGKAYYQKIFKLHQVNENEFNKSMYLLKQDPEALESVYKDVIAAIEQRENGK